MRNSLSMSKTDRFDVILNRLSSGGSLAVKDLAQDLGVSAATVRRDLGEMARQSLLARTHGGAVASSAVYELPMRYRTGRRDQKRRIGAAAASVVADEAVVAISGGTTTTEAARALVTHKGLTVVTNAINIAAELALRPNVRLVVTGGLARSASYELVGTVAEETVQSYNFDVLLLGADGVSVEAGCTTHDLVEARVNAAMVKRAKRVVVLADSSKIGKVTFARICEIEKVDVLITSTADDGDELADGAPLAQATSEAMARVAEAGVNVKEV